VAIWVAAHQVIKTYDKLLDEAISLTQGHIEPYLQQLSQFNATQIEMLRASTKLSENIAVSSLQKGMMHDKDEDEIKNNINLFTDPEATLSHGRALNYDMLEGCGLNIKFVNLDEELWKNVWSLYMRSKFIVDRGDFGSKLVETLENSYTIRLNYSVMKEFQENKYEEYLMLLNDNPEAIEKLNKANSFPLEKKSTIIFKEESIKDFDKSRDKKDTPCDNGTASFLSK
jgi:hypothetical protein